MGTEAKYVVRLSAAERVEWAQRVTPGATAGSFGPAVSLSILEHCFQSDPITLHRRHETDVVCSKAGDDVAFNQFLPKFAQFRAVGQQDKPASKESQPVPSLRGGHSQSVAFRGGWTWRTGRHAPKLVEVLRNDDQPLTSPHKRLNCGSRDAGLRILRPRHSREQVCVEKNHSPSIRV